MKTPLGWAAARWSLGERALRWGTSAALLVSIFIVFSGGVVRVTGSGLGCPTWPACEPGSLTTTPQLGIHGLIEFTNRSLTGVLILAVGWAIVAARLQRPRNRTLTRLAWSQFWLVVANSVAGGISVLTGLNPYVVALHFVLAIALLTTTTLTWHRARQFNRASNPVIGASKPVIRASKPAAGTDAAALASPVRATPAAATLSVVLVIATFLLIVLGTVVSGSGQHSGDSAKVPRMAFVWAEVTVAHGVLGTAVILVAVALLIGLRGPDARLGRLRTIVFLGITVLQAVLGVVQATTGSPAALVALHVFGAALVWVGALRVLLDVNPTLFRTEPASVPNPVPSPQKVST